MATQKRRKGKPVVMVEEPVVTGARSRSRDETRSHFVPPRADDLPSETNPCRAAKGNHWVHAFGPHIGEDINRLLTGKWLIRVGHPNAAYCWDRVRRATEDGTLGLAAKVSTDWAMTHDPAGFGAEGRGGWRSHVVCVYTRDWRDREDVLRVGKRLVEVDAVRTQPITYKADASTFGGKYAGNSPGEVAIYRMARPYEQLQEYADNIKVVLRLVDHLQHGGGHADQAYRDVSQLSQRLQGDAPRRSWEGLSCGGVSSVSSEELRLHYRHRQA